MERHIKMNRDKKNEMGSGTEKTDDMKAEQMTHRWTDGLKKHFEKSPEFRKKTNSQRAGRTKDWLEIRLTENIKKQRQKFETTVFSVLYVPILVDIVSKLWKTNASSQDFMAFGQCRALFPTCVCVCKSRGITLKLEKKRGDYPGNKARI